MNLLKFELMRNYDINYLESLLMKPGLRDLRGESNFDLYQKYETYDFVLYNSNEWYFHHSAYESEC